MHSPSFPATTEPLFEEIKLPSQTERYWYVTPPSPEAEEYYAFLRDAEREQRFLPATQQLHRGAPTAVGSTLESGSNYIEPFAGAGYERYDCLVVIRASDYTRLKSLLQQVQIQALYWNDDEKRYAGPMALIPNLDLSTGKLNYILPGAVAHEGQVLPFIGSICAIRDEHFASLVDQNAQQLTHLYEASFPAGARTTAELPQVEMPSAAWAYWHRQPATEKEETYREYLRRQEEEHVFTTPTDLLRRGKPLWPGRPATFETSSNYIEPFGSASSYEPYNCRVLVRASDLARVSNLLNRVRIKGLYWDWYGNPKQYRGVTTLTPKLDLSTGELKYYSSFHTRNAVLIGSRTEVGVCPIWDVQFDWLTQQPAVTSTTPNRGEQLTAQVVQSFLRTSA